MNETLIQDLKQVLADSYVFTYKAQTYHWNVEGSNFPQYHEFFGNIYEEVYGSIDTTAEFIRAIDGYTPVSFRELLGMTIISEDDEVVSPMSMVGRLLDANNLILATLTMAYRSAEQATELGLANYLQDRIAAHQKHGWMLKAITK
jgi:starvation-inducible DNA-binding protein